MVVVVKYDVKTERVIPACEDITIKPPDLKFLCLIPFKKIIEYYSDSEWSSIPIKFFDDYCIFDFEKQLQHNTPDPDILLEINKHLENEN